MRKKLNYNLPLLVLPNSQEHWDLSKTVNILKDEHNWLEDAITLDVYKSNSKRLRGLINSIFDEVQTIIPTPNKSRYKEALKMVIINLWCSHFKGKPVRYSRDRAYYSRTSRYGKLFIKYDRLIPTIDALEALGYIQQKPGFWDSDKQLGRTTRMWSTPKLWPHFKKYGLKQPDFFTIARPENVIELRDGGNHNKGIKFSYTPAIRRIRDDLERYNEFLERHDITVNLDGSVKVDTEFLVNSLYRGLLNGTVKIDLLKLATRIGTPNFTVGIINRPAIQLFSSNNQYTSIITNQYTVPYHSIPLSTMTQRFLPEALVFLGFRYLDRSKDKLMYYLLDLAYSIAMDPDKERRKTRLADQFALEEIGIDRLILRLAYEYVHRVFNRGSFDLGGRGYGALHQRIPKHLRQLIHIDGQPTVELDYSAYHILMLYHKEGIDYQEDPYLVCEGPEMRSTYKAVGLVAINAENESKAYGGIYDELKSRGIPLPAGEKPLVRLLTRFREAHPAIAKYLYSGMGLHLMNLDSRIMNSILMRLMDKGILGLSVYDSVIVAEQHQEYLHQVMMEEYKKEMGFNPRIG
jgi:hypothetical protein